MASVKGARATMIVLVTIMNVLPEKQKEVLQTLLSMVELPEKETGCLNYGISCDIEDKNVFNLISAWKTRQHLNLHMRSERFSVLLGTKSLLCEPLKMQIFTVSESEGIEAVESARNKRNKPTEKKESLAAPSPPPPLSGGIKKGSRHR
jgi:quinol monooxygenase YgiN